MKASIIKLLKKNIYFDMAVISVVAGVIAFNIFSPGVPQQIAVEPKAMVEEEATVSDYKTEYDLAMDSMIDYYQCSEEAVETCYKLTVNDDIEMVFASREDLELALEIVQQTNVGKRFESDVRLVKTSEGLYVKSVVEEKYPLKSAAVLNDIGLSTSSVNVLSTNSDYVTELTVEEDIENDGADNNQPAILLFSEEIEITAVEGEEVKTVTAVEGASILNKTNVKPDEYVVESGDSPYTIAIDYEMSLDELYEINDGLEEKAKGLQIGDTVVVEKLEPELSIIVEEELTFYETIEHGVTYQDDDTLYKTLEKESEAGVDGTKKVRAVVQMLNGEEIEREIISEAVITPAKNSIMLVGTKPLPDKGAVGNFVIPVKSYTITSPFGSRWGGFHTGVDLANDYGTSIYASDGGKVTVSGWSGGYGYMVEIDHGNGRVSRYAHCSDLLVTVGEVVGQGDKIAKLGNSGNSTGPHLHFEIRLDGEPVNPMNYMN